jgi:ethanolamine ammonia-lyase small subunit
LLVKKNITTIHIKRTPAVEAGTWLAELLKEMYDSKPSGLALRDARNKENR